MNRFAYCVALVFLGILALEDIRERRIALKNILLFGGMAALYRCLTAQISMEEIIFSLLPGAGMLLLGFLTREQIGYGDGLTVAVLGLWTGGRSVLVSVIAAVLCTGVWSLICVIKRRMEPIPFVPFLLIGMEMMLAYA